jgi:hypothetical protein
MQNELGPTSRRLRVGILLDSFVQPAWIGAALTEIRAAGELELALVILNATRGDVAASGRKKRSLLLKLGHWALSWRQAPYWAYLKMENRLWPAAEDPFRLSDLSETLSDVPTITVNTVRKKFSDWFPDEAVEAILAYDLDVAQRFGFRILRGRALEIARHGVWSFHHGDYLAYRGGPAGFWEVLDGTRRTGMLLQRLTEDLDDGVPIASVFSQTDLRSVILNRRRYYPLGPRVLARELVRLRRNGPPAPKCEWSCYSAPMFVDPQPRDVAVLGTRLLTRGSKAALRRIGVQSHAGVSCIFRSDPGGAPHGGLYRARPLRSSAGAQWLDPCAGAYGEHRFILVSEKSTSEAARLVLMSVEAKSVRDAGLPIYAESGGDVRSPASFTWHGTPYIYLAISGEPGLRLLRCLRWPDYWELAEICLPHVQSRSVAIAEIDQTWWLFVGAQVSPGRMADLLHLYHAASPLGPWIPHALNPVRLGDDGVCPAGPPFSFAGSWYRPARDFTAEVGCSVAVMRIERLDSENFQETGAGLITPNARLGVSDVTAVSAIEGLTVFGITRSVWRRPWRLQPPEVRI